MDKHIELELRQEYSKIYPQLESLELWVKNTFNELCLHENLIYDFDIRIKNIESLLEKIDNKIIPRLKKNNATLNAETILNNIDDLLGARIMTLVPGKLPDLHDLLLKMARLEPKLITVHYPNNQPHRINKFILPAGPDHEKKDNCVGYFGIHYIFKPKPIDEFYTNSSCALFNRFELQLRTLMQHAWSEVQHKVIYKSNKPDYSKPLEGQFVLLASFIDSCDDCLSDLTYGKITPTHSISINQGQAFFNLTNEIQTIIKNWEAQDQPTSNRKSEAENFKNGYKTQIAELLAKPTDNDTLLPKSELAEFFLKGGFPEEAYNIYQSIRLPNNKEGWLWLRIAETCNILMKNEEALENLDLLKQFLANQTPTSQHSALYFGAAMLSWKLNKWDYAVFFGELAVLSSQSPAAMIRDNINYIYYRLELLTHQQASIKLADLQALETYALNAINLSAQTNNKLGPEKCDTLMYFYSKWANMEMQAGNKTQAKLLIQKSSKYMQQLYEETSKNNLQRKQCWEDHTVEIVSLKAQLGEF